MDAPPARRPGSPAQPATAVAEAGSTRQRYVVELYLSAFATQAEVLHHLRTHGSPEDRRRLDAILRDWQALRPRVRETEEREAGIAETIRLQPIPAEYGPRVQELTVHPLFQQTFRDFHTSFELVEIDKLIAPQRAVNLTYVEELKQTLPSAPSLRDLVEICLSPVRPGAPVQYLRSGSNTHIFSSPSADFRFLDSAATDGITVEDFQYAESGGVPTASVRAFVGYGCASINIFRVGRRLILNNGFHRVYALRTLGVTDIPVVVQHVHTVALEFPSEVNGFPAAYLLGSPRPVLLKDFLEPGFTVRMSVRERVRAIKVTVSASRYDVPI